MNRLSSQSGILPVGSLRTGVTEFSSLNTLWLALFEQQQRERAPEQAPWTPKSDGPFDGPRAPGIEKPDTARLLKRMKAIENNQARKYRQRSGE